MTLQRTLRAAAICAFMLMGSTSALSEPQSANQTGEKQGISENNAGRPNSDRRSPTAKRSSRTQESRADLQTSSQQKPLGNVQKTADGGRRVGDQANDFWTTCFGGFHLFGDDGQAVYRYPAEATGAGYDTHWTFTDDYPVDDREGWTYKEDGYEFYMFFARFADSNGKFWVGYSHDNQYFTFYAWAD